MENPTSRQNGKSGTLTIAGIPIGPDMYTTCYYDALSRSGVRVVEGSLSGRWLWGNRQQVDFLHLNWPSFLYSEASARGSLLNFLRFVALLMLARILRIKLLWTAHNLYPHERCGLPVLDAMARRVIIRLSHRVFSHGVNAAAVVAKEFPAARNKLSVFPHGHWAGLYANDCSRQEARNRLGIPGRQTVFLFFGACREYKNLEHLVDAFQGVVFEDTVLWIVGKFQKAEYLSRVQRQIAKQPQGISLMSGFVPDDEVQIYMKACDLVVLPYAEILTSGAAMLALSFGRPVIAPRLGHLRDVIDERSGVLYDHADPQGLQNAMKASVSMRFDEQSILQHAKTFDWREASTMTLRGISATGHQA